MAYACSCRPCAMVKQQRLGHKYFTSHIRGSCVPILFCRLIAFHNSQSRYKSHARLSLDLLNLKTIIYTHVFPHHIPQTCSLLYVSYLISNVVGIVTIIGAHTSRLDSATCLTRGLVPRSLPASTQSSCECASKHTPGFSFAEKMH